MLEDYCPKCKCKRVGNYEYCVCGHKWDDPIQTLKDIFGIDLEKGKE